MSAASRAGRALRDGSVRAMLTVRVTVMQLKRGLARRALALSGLLGRPGRSALPLVDRGQRRGAGDAQCQEWLGTPSKAALETLKREKIAQRARAEVGAPGRSGRRAVPRVVVAREEEIELVASCLETLGNVWVRGSRRRSAGTRCVLLGPAGDRGAGAVPRVDQEVGRGGAIVNHQVMPANVKGKLARREFVRSRLARSQLGVCGASGVPAQGAVEKEERRGGGDVPLPTWLDLACSPRLVLERGRRRGCAGKKIAPGLAVKS